MCMNAISGFKEKLSRYRGKPRKQFKVVYDNEREHANLNFLFFSGLSSNEEARKISRGMQQYRNKYATSEVLKKYKTRIVDKGFCWNEISKTLLLLTARKEMYDRQINVITSYFNSTKEENILITIPEIMKRVLN